MGKRVSHELFHGASYGVTWDHMVYRMEYFEICYGIPWYESLLMGSPPMGCLMRLQWGPMGYIPWDFPSENEVIWNSRYGK